MSRFTRVISVSPLPDGENWRLHEPLSYDVGEEDSGETITVPEGFVTDFASIPRPLWSFIPKWGKHGHAAVLHDYLYWSKLYTRERSDEIFLEAMRVLKTPGWQAKIIYRAVRLAGSGPWEKNRGRDRIMKERPKVTDFE